MYSSNSILLLDTFNVSKCISLIDLYESMMYIKEMKLIISEIIKGDRPTFREIINPIIDPKQVAI